MKIRAMFESAGDTTVELVPENEGEAQMLGLLRDGATAKCTLKYDGARPPYRKVVGASIAISNREE